VGAAGGFFGERRRRARATWEATSGFAGSLRWAPRGLGAEGRDCRSPATRRSSTDSRRAWKTALLAIGHRAVYPQIESPRRAFSPRRRRVKQWITPGVPPLGHAGTDLLTITKGPRSLEAVEQHWLAQLDASSSMVEDRDLRLLRSRAQRSPARSRKGLTKRP